jgi:hypothetical protein
MVAPRNGDAAASRLDRKPDRCCNHCDNDHAPHQRRNLFRTPASRGIVGGVVEFLIHAVRLQVEPWMRQDYAGANLSKHRQHLVPQRRVFPIAIGL